MVDHDSWLLESKLMYSYENRLATFRNWPFTECCRCTPENMAKAGFLHCPTENEPDVATCFFCLKELESWEPEDEPWLEHQRHSPACAFLALKADVLDLTVEEFFRLEMERLTLYMKKVAAEQVSTYRESVKATRVEVLENLTNPNP
ncbi:baculoviral IAP repeat-containing protein 5b [Scyliorhinus canicula]|uniref:baculoviral IAP repeat-containing protein 5b n=1 Tax=Scyliorhinus canicula TaxID=7830 RepID=UPI0018F5F7FA|nr:baculoviral IAP repeat-containing protein 5b [Scyliorhinus canicula]